MTAHDSASHKANRIAVLLLLIVISAVFVRMIWGTPGIMFSWTAAVVTAVDEPTFATLIG